MLNTTTTWTPPPSLEYNASVFWAVNGVVFFVAVLLTFWCVRSSGIVPQLRVAWACCYCRQQRRREMEEALQRQEQEEAAAREQLEKFQRNRDTPDQRRQKLESCFQTHKTIMIVTVDDLVEESQVESLSDAEFLEHGNAEQLPVDGMSTSQQQTHAASIDIDTTTAAVTDGFLMLKRQPQPCPIQNCCAVCLSSYEVGDEVVWSPNANCQHAFHQACIVEWLVKMYKQRCMMMETAPSNPCPCCRQEFVTLDSSSPAAD